MKYNSNKSTSNKNTFFEFNFFDIDNFNFLIYLKKPNDASIPQKSPDLPKL